MSAGPRRAGHIPAGPSVTGSESGFPHASLHSGLSAAARFSAGTPARRRNLSTSASKALDFSKTFPFRTSCPLSRRAEPPPRRAPTAIPPDPLPPWKTLAGPGEHSPAAPRQATPLRRSRAALPPTRVADCRRPDWTRRGEPCPVAGWRPMAEPGRRRRAGRGAARGRPNADCCRSRGGFGCRGCAGLGLLLPLSLSLHPGSPGRCPRGCPGRVSQAHGMV